MPKLVPNNPQKRMKWVIEQYWAKDPIAVLDTAQVATYLLGQERNEDWTYVVSMARADTMKPRSSARLLEGVRHLPSQNDFDFLLPWVAKQLFDLRRALGGSAILDDLSRRDREEAHTYAEAVVLLRQKAPVIAMWARRERKDLGRVSLQEAFEAAADFETDGKDVAQGEIVYRFPDGFTVQDLSAECLDDEGEVMQHCVGGYESDVASGRVNIFSLRDKAGRPHATIEWDIRKGKVRQVKGKQNEPPAEKYQVKVDEFIKEHLGVEPLTLKEREIVEELEAHGEWAHGGDAEGTAPEWAWVDDASEVGRWLAAGIYDGSTAESLAADGARPRDVAAMGDWLKEYLAEGGEWNVARIGDVIATAARESSRQRYEDDEAGWERLWLKQAKAWDTRHNFDEFEEWIRLGVWDAADADLWEDIGKPGDEALLPWIEAFGGDHSRDALPWFQAGVTDPEVARALEDLPEAIGPRNAGAVYEDGMSAEDVIAAVEGVAE